MRLAGHYSDAADCAPCGEHDVIRPSSRPAKLLRLVLRQVCEVLGREPRSCEVEPRITGTPLSTYSELLMLEPNGPDAILAAISPTDAVGHLLAIAPLLHGGTDRLVHTALYSHGIVSASTNSARSRRSISKGFMNATPTPMQTLGIFTRLIEASGFSCVITTCPPASACATR